MSNDFMIGFLLGAFIGGFISAALEDWKRR